MKLIIPGLLLSLLLVAVAAAQERIEGAFGQKLGAVFDPQGAPPEQGMENTYRFPPAAPFEGLTNYSVVVTPKTHRIAAINASGETPDTESAWKLATVLGIILRNKYESTAAPEGAPSETSATPAATQPQRPEVINSGPALLDEPTQIVQGQRTIQVAAREQSRLPSAVSRKGAVYLSYRDKDLLVEAQREATMIRLEKEAAEKAEKEAREKAAQQKWERERELEKQRRAEMREKLKEEAHKLDASGL